MTEQAEALAEGVWRFDLGAVNAYLVDDGGVLTLVDAGTPGDTDAILAGIRDAGFEPEAVERVLVTHYDFDHVGALPAFEHAAVYAGASEAGFVAGTRLPPVLSRKGFLQRLAARFVDHPETDVKGLADGETVGSFTVYATPGHTPGHVAFVSETLDVAFVGDLVRETDGALSASPWYFNADTAAVTWSIRDLADRLTSVSVVAPGHGDPISSDGWRALEQLAASGS